MALMRRGFWSRLAHLHRKFLIPLPWAKNLNSQNSHAAAAAASRRKMRIERFFTGVIAAGVVTLGMTPASNAQNRVVPDTYLAVTTNMQPTDVEIKADILRWSSDEERQSVIAALQSEDPAGALGDLPTMGVIWRSTSSVGNSIKYAHRAETADGGERITLITAKAIGYSSFEPWAADNAAPDASLEYSVIELIVDSANDGQGTMSMAAEVNIDVGSNLVSLDRGDNEPLLTNVRLAEKPYWAARD